jgi:hypothetical protein
MSYHDGRACHMCGDDAVWMPMIAEGSILVDRPLCGGCTDDLTTLCPTCDHRIWQADGVRIYSSPDLYCRTCAEAHPAMRLSADRESRRDIARDDSFDGRRR